MRSAVLDRVPGIVYGFGTMAHPIPEPFAAEWDRARASWTQVHKADACEVLRAGQECGEVDATFTYASAQPVGARHADCTPILLARRDGAAVAAVHAGWRGTRAHILRALWSRLVGRGERAADWVATVGPTIGPCCYEVSPELARDFATEFAQYGVSVVVPRTRMLDLPAINAAELRALGICEVEILRACTSCSVGPQGAPIYHSYRREQKGGSRQISIIARR